MKSKTLLQCIINACVVALLLITSSHAGAGGILPQPPPASRGPVPENLVNCTAELLNVSNRVDNTTGNVFIFNIPTSTTGLVYVKVTCQNANGETVQGLSEAFTASPGVQLNVSNITWTLPPAPTRLEVTPTNSRVTVGTTQNLTVTAYFADAPTKNVTSGEGTRYFSNNTAVATVNNDGVVTGVAPGLAFIFVSRDDGAFGAAAITVTSTGVSTITASPTGISFEVHPLFPVPTRDLKVIATMTDNSTLDITPSSNGVLYSSTNTNVATVSPEGRVVPTLPVGYPNVPLASGECDIIIVDPASGKSTSVDVSVTSFTPKPVGAYNTPGYARTADIVKNRVYIADDTQGLQVVDVDVVTGVVTPVKSLLFTSASAWDVKVQGEFAAVALGAAGVSLVSVKPGTTETMTEHHRLGGLGTVRDLSFSGDKVYVADVTGNFRTLQVGLDPQNPGKLKLTQLNSTAVAGSPQAVSGDSTRNLAVVRTTLGVTAIQMNEQGGIISSVSVPLTPGGTDIVLFGTSAYTTFGTDTNTGGISRIDVSNPASPSVKASSPAIFPTTARGIAVSNTTMGGAIVAVADHLYENTVPLFNSGNFNQFFPLIICGPTDSACTFPATGKGPVRWDTDSTGIALGDGFGVTTNGGDGIQVFTSLPSVDNAGAKPWAGINTPKQDTTVIANTQISISASAGDDYGVAYVEFLIDGTSYFDYVPPYTINYVPQNTGPLEIKVIATDLGGNESDQQTVTVLVQAPSGPTLHTIATSFYSSCSIISGSVRCWGDNTFAECGTGTIEQSVLTPKTVFQEGAAFSGDAVAIGGGGYHFCVVRQGTGKVACWGDGGWGQLGDGIGNSSYVPVEVANLTNVTAVEGGAFHTCALRSDKKVFCWGQNAYGQLGTGDYVDAYVPIEANITDVADIAAGDYHTCARKTSGQVFCWGYNFAGQLGNNSTVDSATPVQAGSIGDAVEISAQDRFTCARHAGGTMSCWGDNAYGQIGTGTIGGYVLTPTVVKVAAGVPLSNVKELSVGYFHNCARDGTAHAYCWGSNQFGQLGTDNIPLVTGATAYAVPVENLSDVRQLASGAYHSCAVLGSGGVACWGMNHSNPYGGGMLGNGTTTDSVTPVEVLF
jgi:alpha-tubulin suppressor-like RCC1 family protein